MALVELESYVRSMSFLRHQSCFSRVLIQKQEAFNSDVYILVYGSEPKLTFIDGLELYFFCSKGVYYEMFRFGGGQRNF